jgi:hypothetical protein
MMRSAVVLCRLLFQLASLPADETKEPCDFGPLSFRHEDVPRRTVWRDNSQAQSEVP